MAPLILSINPGGSSTKIGLFETGQELEPVWQASIPHRHDEISRFDGVLAQRQWRRDLVLATCRDRALPWEQLAAVAGRGGPLRPLPGGTYRIEPSMLAAIEAGEYQAEHPSLLGILLAQDVAVEHGVPAFTVDPVSTDELEPEARLSGHPEIPRQSLTHALNIRDLCRRVAAELGRPYQELRLVACHLGSGASVTAHRDGRMVDVNDSSGEGPFCTQRCGGLPVRSVAKLLSRPGADPKAFQAELMRRGGLVAYVETDDFRVVLERADQGDLEAELIYRAFLHQIKKEIGAYAAVLDGRVDAVLFAGGLIQSTRLADDLRQSLSWIAPVYIHPGEDELAALARGAARVLDGTEEPRRFVRIPDIGGGNR